jgi:hypothetical protein
MKDLRLRRQRIYMKSYQEKIKVYQEGSIQQIFISLTYRLRPESNKGNNKNQITPTKINT